VRDYETSLRLAREVDVEVLVRRRASDLAPVHVRVRADQRVAPGVLRFNQAERGRTAGLEVLAVDAETGAVVPRHPDAGRVDVFEARDRCHDRLLFGRDRSRGRL
jgi:hypothetical protein